MTLPPLLLRRLAKLLLGLFLFGIGTSLMVHANLGLAPWDVLAQGMARATGWSFGAVIVLIGGANGCFGGMGIVSRCADTIVMSDVGRLGMSGPEVIEASHGVEEFDSRDRGLVWRTTGGKHRWLTGDCDKLVEDDVAAFRAAAITALGETRPVTLERLEAEHSLLVARLRSVPDTPDEIPDAITVWHAHGVPDAARVPDMEVAELLELDASGAGGTGSVDDSAGTAGVRGGRVG